MKYVVLNKNVKSKCTALVAKHVTSKFSLTHIAFFVPVLLLLPTICDLVSICYSRMLATVVDTGIKQLGRSWSDPCAAS